MELKMSLKHLPKTIPTRDHEFSINLQGILTKQDYEGTFKSKIPNLKAQAQMAKTKAFLNAGFEDSLDPSTKNLHHMVAYLKHTVTDGPEWFYSTDYGYDLYDMNIIEDIYQNILKAEESWLELVWGKSENVEK